MRTGNRVTLRLLSLRLPALGRLLPAAAILLASLFASADFRLPDLNGDGTVDIVLRHDDGRWRSVAIAGARVVTAEPLPMTANPAWHPAAIGDFNGDGTDDVLLRRTDRRWFYYPMDGGQVLTDQRGRANLSSRPDWRPVATGDLNGDGRDDLLLRSAEGAWSYYPMNGRRTIAAERGWADLPHDPNWRLAGLADFDGDGRDDVLLRHGTAGTWRLYRMDGRRIQSSSMPGFTTNRLWRVAGVGDFSGDGRAEVLFRRVDGRWGRQSAAATGPPAAVRLPADWHWRLAGIGDLDGDGGDDVLVRHDQDGRWRRLLRRSGAGDPRTAPVALPRDLAWLPPAPVVHIPDPQLRAAVEAHLGKQAGDRITRRELARLTELQAADQGIADLTGLGFASALHRLYLRYNLVADLSPLAGLTDLTHLLLYQNRIQDLAPLAGLPNLAGLGIGRNGVIELSLLPHLPNLRYLFAEYGGISDIRPLSAFARLDRVILDGNPVEDLSPLADLPRLRTLGIDETGVADLGFVAEVAPALVQLYADSNGISDLAGVERLTNLRFLHVSDNDIDDLSSLEQLEKLEYFDAWHNRIDDLSPLAGLTSLRSLRLDGNRIQSLAPLRGLKQLSRLRAPSNRVADLSPLADLTDLVEVHLARNEIVDVAPLANLAKLRELNLAHNRILDLSPLAGLTQLESLQLDGNRIGNIDAVETLTGLTSLRIAENEVVDLSPLAHLTGLVTLGLAGNAIIDITPLTGLIKLRELDLAFNRIADLSGLADNVGLGAGDSVDVRGNPLGDADAITMLEERGVEVRSGGPRIVSVHGHTVVVMDIDEPVASSTAYRGMPLDIYAHVFFTHFRDEFDYLLFFSNLDSIRDHEDAPYYGIYLSVMNDTEGLGIGTFYDSRYGSAGRLRGVVHFPYNRALRNGPALHELQHAWSNFVVDTGWPSHWGFSSAHGQLGGFDMADFNDLGDGRYTAGSFGPFANGGNRPAYSPIELYYAGFLPPEEVPDLHVAEDGAWLIEDEELVRGDDGHGVFTASGVTTYTIQDLIAKHGPRVPSMADAQWHHRAALVLLVDDDHPATEEQLATLVEHAAYMSHPGNDDDYLQNFHEATGGRGSISFDLAGAVKAEESPPANLPASFGVVPPPRFTSLDGHCRTLHQH